MLCSKCGLYEVECLSSGARDRHSSESSVVVAEIGSNGGRIGEPSLSRCPMTGSRLELARDWSVVVQRGQRSP